LSFAICSFFIVRHHIALPTVQCQTPLALSRGASILE
jgi:hypothetical protein